MIRCKFMHNHKRIGIFIICLLLILLSVFFVNRCNPYLRTDIFRKIAKGNWYIVTDKDTIFSVGYYGIKKSVIESNNKFKLLNENNEICKGRLFGRSACIVGDYAMRSYVPGAVEDDVNGELIVMRKNNLTIINNIFSDIKLVEVHALRNLLLVSGLKGFDIYNISSPKSPKIIFRHRTKKYKEFQGFDIFEIDNRTYVAFALYGDGLEIWDITNPSKAKSVSSLKLNDRIINGKRLYRLQSMDVIADYPYLYATVGPMKDNFENINSIRGIIIYDVSNINRIKMSIVEIPKYAWYNKKTGDCQPTYICKRNNNVFINFSEKGIAIFKKRKRIPLSYIGTINPSNKETIIQPISISDDGYLLAGDYYWTNIYGIKYN